MSFDPIIREKLTEKIHEVNPEIFVVDIELHRSKTSILRILIDTDEGINIDECKAVSRNISRWLEEEPEVLNFRYHLEVGSPGVGRPLKILRQYHQNVGRSLKVKLLEDYKEVKGELIEVRESSIVLNPDTPKKKSKGSASEGDQGPMEIQFEEIKEAKVLVSFK